MNFLQEAKKLKAELVAIRRHLHQNPELSGQEYATSKYISGLLRKWGLKVKQVPNTTGIVGLLEPPTTNGQRRTGCVALRADMDALPIQEETGKIYASRKSGVMHACGHDGNMTCVLGAARLLAQQKKQLRKTVKFIFQPAEEISGGAKSMIKGGVLKNPPVEMIMGLHVYMPLAAGTIGIKYGQMMAAVDEFTLTILGSGGHGAAPQRGVDAIAISGSVITALQQIISRQTDPLDPVVLTIGTINGGSRYNILADKVVMTGTVRTLNEQTHHSMPVTIEKVVKGVTAAFGATYRLEYKVLGCSLENNESVLDKIKYETGQLLGTEKVIILKRPSMGGEDFAAYLETVPGAFIYLGAGNPAKGIKYPWHHSRFDIDEEALPIGAAVLAESVWTWQ